MNPYTDLITGLTSAIPRGALRNPFRFHQLGVPFVPGCSELFELARLLFRQVVLLANIAGQVVQMRAFSRGLLLKFALGCICARRFDQLPVAHPYSDLFSEAPIQRGMWSAFLLVRQVGQQIDAVEFP